MDTARIREGIRKMRFSTILDRWDAGEMTQEAAAELLGMSVRSFQRWKERYEADGEAGLVDRRGSPSPRRRGRSLSGCSGSIGTRLHGQAFPRAADQAPQLPARLHGDEAASAPGGPGQGGAQAFGASQEAAAPADARHDAASGRIAARLDRRPACNGSHRDDGRRDERDLLDVSDRRAGNGFDLYGAARGDRRTRPVLRALHRPRQPLFSHPGSGRQGVAHAIDPSGTGLGASGDRAHRRLFAAGALNAPSGCSPPCRTGCPRNCGWPGSTRSRRPTPG